MYEYKKIFVVGCPRSGTSWISKLIGSHVDVLDVGTESHAYPLVFEPLRHAGTKSISRRLRHPLRTISSGGWNFLIQGDSEDVAWRRILEDYRRHIDSVVGLHHFVSLDELKGIIAEVKNSVNGEDALGQAQEAIKMVFDVYWKKQCTTESVFIEKTPLHIRYVPEILGSFPESVVVEVVRDGRDVDVSRSALATNPSKVWAQATTIMKIERWIECIELGNSFLGNPELAPRIMRVYYEDMRCEPNLTLERIFSFCRLEHTEVEISAILNGLDINNIEERGDGHYVRSGMVGQWQNELTMEAKNLWDLKAGHILKVLGYSPST